MSVSQTKLIEISEQSLNWIFQKGMRFILILFQQFKYRPFLGWTWLKPSNRIFKTGFKHSRITVTARSIASLRTGCLKLRLVIKTAVYLQAIPPALTTSFWMLRLLMLFSEGLIPFDQMLSWVIGWSAFNRIFQVTLFHSLAEMERSMVCLRNRGEQCHQPLRIRHNITESCSMPRVVLLCIKTI